jgi:hypothetical protein
MTTQWRAQLTSLAACVAFTSAGCISVGTMQRAETLGAGRTQFGLEPALWGVASSAGHIVLPTIGGAIRYGVLDNLDIGGRVSLAGVEADAKVLLTPRGSVMVSLAPSIGGLAIGGAASGTTGSTTVGYINAQLPVLVGIPLGGHELILGPKLVDYTLFGGASVKGGSGSAAINILSAGASIGFAARINPSFQLLPEIAFAYPIYGSGTASASNGASSTTSSALNGNGAVFQVGLGFLFGS